MMEEPFSEKGLSGTFNDDVLDYGPDVAFAAQDIEMTIDQLKGSDDILERIISKSFDMMDQEERFDVFIEMYQMLSRKQQDQIATNGF